MKKVFQIIAFVAVAIVIMGCANNAEAQEPEPAVDVACGHVVSCCVVKQKRTPVRSSWRRVKIITTKAKCVVKKTRCAACN